MRYIDSGNRHPDESLGRWLEGVVPASIAAVRWQTGYFRTDALGLLLPALERAREEDLLLRVLIGSNDRNTLHRDLVRLLPVLGVPRDNAQLGLVSFAGGAYFHPKVIHLTRRDDSQIAYVGSANLTASGLAGLHVEAGVILDTREGDEAGLLLRIAEGIDNWFVEGRPGLETITDRADLDRLLAEGVLGEEPPPRSGSVSGAGGGAAERARLRPLITLPPGPSAEGEGDQDRPYPSLPSTRSVPRAEFPDYLLFEPGRDTPTRGGEALTGASLPSGAEGLIIRLNRDSARHFFGGPGTSNISVPVATISTIRFGVFRGEYNRPRAEFRLIIEYFGKGEHLTIDSETNIMAYGFLEGETGHGDIRMLVPAAVRGLAEELQARGHRVPGERDLALMQWPRPHSYEFRLTYLAPGEPAATRARELFEEAARRNELVGEGACWLPSGIAPVS